MSFQPKSRMEKVSNPSRMPSPGKFAAAARAAPEVACKNVRRSMNTLVSRCGYALYTNNNIAKRNVAQGHAFFGGPAVFCGHTPTAIFRKQRDGKTEKSKVPKNRQPAP